MNSIYKKLENFFKGKRVLILGFGREGRSTLELLRNMDCFVGIADQKPCRDDETESCSVFFGDDYLDCLDKFDIIMKTPGIALFNDISDSVRERITSQTDLLLRFCDNRTIGITGTKGKSTTSSLTAHILGKCGFDAKLIGNIGIPPLDKINEFREDTVVVCEMSCHQLEYVKASPDIAVLLNVFEEHLDHYVDFNAYRAAKENIYKYQTKNDLLIVNSALEPKEISAKTITASLTDKADICLEGNYLYVGNSVYVIPKIRTKLLGRHNLYNIGIAAYIAENLGCKKENILSAVADFEGLPHRLENVGTVNGAQYINDSISTCPSTAIAAVRSFDKVDTIIIGGMDRGIDYKELSDFLNTGCVANVILLPDSGHNIEGTLDRSKMNVYKASDMEDAVDHAKNVTKIRCLLSPAAASYGFYKNFEERGEHFRELVLKK